MRPLLIGSACVALGLAVAGCSNAERGYVIGSNLATMGKIRDVAIALEGYKAEHGAYPVATSGAELRTLLSLDDAKLVDRWNEPLIIRVKTDGYLIASERGDRDGEKARSITCRDGKFTDYNPLLEKKAREYEAVVLAVRNR